MIQGIDVGKLAGLKNSHKLAAVVGTGIAVGILSWTFLISGKIDDLNVLVAKEATLRQEFTEKNEKAKNLPAYKKQIIEIENSFDTLLAQLPEKSEMDALLNDINQSGVQRGLDFETFKPATNEVLTDIYAEMPVQIKVLGRYADFGEFAADIAKLPRIVNMTDVNLSLYNQGAISAKPSGAKPGAPAADDRLVMEAMIKTYRYLDQSEMAARKEAAKKAKKAKNPGGK